MLSDRPLIVFVLVAFTVLLPVLVFYVTLILCASNPLGRTLETGLPCAVVTEQSGASDVGNWMNVEPPLLNVRAKSFLKGVAGAASRQQCMRLTVDRVSQLGKFN